MLAAESLAHLETVFRSMYGDESNTRNAAIFIRHESEGRLQCEVLAYFSPDAADAAAAVDAELCRKPARGDLSLLVGSKEAWTLLPE